MAFIGSNNALAWAHFRLRGGWQRSLAVTVPVLLVLAGLVITMAQLSPDRDDVLWGWTVGLLAVQAACLVLYIPGRLGTIIRSDLQSKMIESHRLMPMPPAHAIAGYIMGAATQPLVFCGGLFVLGALVSSAAGVHLPRWAFANAVLLVFAVFVWVVSAYSSLGGRAGGGVMAAMIIIPWVSQGYVLALLPGTTVLLSPVMGQSVFDFRGTAFSLPPTYAIAFAAQFCFAALCFIGAAREYRNPAGISFDTMLAMGFLLGWVAISLAALRAWDDFRPRGWNPGKAETQVQVVASMIAALLLAIGAVAANAQERARWRRHAALRDPYPMRRPLPIAAVVAVALVAILAIPFAPPRAAHPMQPTMDLILRSAAIIAIALVGLYYFFDIVYAIGRKAFVPGVIWIVMTWGAAIVVDVTRHNMTDEGRPLDVLSTSSPAGALMILWTRREMEMNVGHGVQILFALLPMSVWLLMSRRRRRPVAAAEVAAGYRTPSAR